MTRQEHLEWAKTRAREYLDKGDTTNAMASFYSDLRKHPELDGHPGMDLGGMLMLSGRLSTVATVRDHIEGFN